MESFCPSYRERSGLHVLVGSTGAIEADSQLVRRQTPRGAKGRDVVYGERGGEAVDDGRARHEVIAHAKAKV